MMACVRACVLWSRSRSWSWYDQDHSDGICVLFNIAGAARTSTVLPLARSSSLVSMMKARNHESRFFSLASFSYFSIVRASTCSC